MVGGATAPLNVKKRQSTRPSLETSVFNTTIKPARKTDAPADKTTERANKPTMTKDSVPSVILTKSHGDLRPPTVQPRRRVSASAIEVLSVASKPRTVSAPMSYPAPGHSFVPEISIDTTLPVQEEDTHHKDKDKEEGAANDTNVRVDSLVRSVTAVTATLSEQSTSREFLLNLLSHQSKLLPPRYSS
jgi:hypothetical protein